MTGRVEILRRFNEPTLEAATRGLLALGELEELCDYFERAASVIRLAITRLHRQAQQAQA